MCRRCEAAGDVASATSSARVFIVDLRRPDAMPALDAAAAGRGQDQASWITSASTSWRRRASAAASPWPKGKFSRIPGAVPNSFDTGRKSLWQITKARYDAGHMLEPGNRAPDFKLEGDDGKTHTLKEFAGKTLILVLLPEGQHAGLHDAGLRVPRQRRRL